LTTAKTWFIENLLPSEENNIIAKNLMSKYISHMILIFMIC